MEGMLTLGRGMRKMRAEKPMLTACLEGEEDGEEEGEEEEGEESRILDQVDSAVVGKRRKKQSIYMYLKMRCVRIVRMIWLRYTKVH